MTRAVNRDPGDHLPWNKLKDGTRVLQMRAAISGLITKNNEIGFCMDGATHLIHNPKGITRLKGEDAVKKVLDKASGTRQNVTVIGYLVEGVECDYFWVHDIAPMSVLEPLGGNGATWQFQSFLEK